ncbi:hypothetical protein [Anaerosolibacter sp.]|uniref:hypothetical protein n=1 Tax=Anaerosolibacter sp. TaxID=1872527 RepID=UPI0039EFB473
MEKHRCKVKFHNEKIVCASEILCADCPEKKNCEDIEVFIHEKYEKIKNCMSHDSHRREKGKMKQRRWSER